jgi:hypothetical protein
MTRPAHPKPSTIADQLDQVARHTTGLAHQIRAVAPQAIAQAAILAARGYPTSTLGNGARTTSQNTSTERAALDPDTWAGVDDQLAALLRRAWLTSTQLDQVAAELSGLMVRILAHAGDDDPIPAGRGHCLACETFCIGDGGNDRLRDGFCHPCTTAWSRWRVRQPMGARSDYIRWRRQRLRDLGLMPTNGQAVGA